MCRLSYYRLIGACFIAFIFAPSVVAQDAESLIVDDKDYGYRLPVDIVKYSGDEIEVEGGKIVSYRQSDPYDEYEAAEGANATFVDMMTGKTQLVVPEDSGQMVFYLNVIYRKAEPSIGIGYVARVGTKEDYEAGRIDVIVGRFSDLSQKLLFSDVRFLDSPTHIDGSTISMIVWPLDRKAKYVTVDLASFDITTSESVEIPKPVVITRKPCPCDEYGFGERVQTTFPLEEGVSSE